MYPVVFPGMFDRDNTGQIELHEFQGLWNYINQWKGVFERFDANRTGQIESQELGQGNGTANAWY